MRALPLQVTDAGSGILIPNVDFKVSKNQPSSNAIAHAPMSVKGIKSIFQKKKIEMNKMQHWAHTRNT